ncbi:hypothetical protein ONS95_013382 [Cadophora gregata]|uniref:uncharacterized protein n=1 Tax=Cadophora gregata TaxID=51156 RepID=UPI0026DD7E89|nr:uncharacterized protein ONS95_013382 [Cadophora gregata]KAK0099724.1 hypothetical protein ONS96_008221 [Cadophora gregata f. sp. sojae]KAK0116362.1 hypothetical protein ONS95_013382 [Cadophora gregata]
MTAEDVPDDKATSRSASPASDKGENSAKEFQVSKSIWGQKIGAKEESDTRARPWKKFFGEPEAVKDENGEDWIDYPAIYDVSKKGIAE